MQRLVDSEDDSDDEDALGGDGDSDGGYAEAEAECEAALSAADEAALAAFMSGGSVASEGRPQQPQSQSLGDVIMAKIREAQAQAAAGGGGQDPSSSGAAGASGLLPGGLEPKVVAVYRGVGALLARFTSGKLPKAFKIIPKLRNWEDVLWLTEPEAWSPHAVLAATRIFVSNLNASLAQRYLFLVLLPRMRRDIRDSHKLHFALFQALKKATFKPAAFFKGILLPLAATGTATLREAVILSSLLRRVSLPALHSSATLLRLAEMDYCGTTSFFMRVLLDKKYALPYRVIDALVDHFMRFAADPRAMPVVWHQCLLAFVQRYKGEVRQEDRARLRALCKAQSHYQVTPEVLRELDAADRPGAVGGRAGGSAAGKGRADGMSAMEVQTSIGKNVTEDIRNLPPVPMDDL